MFEEETRALAELTIEAKELNEKIEAIKADLIIKMKEAGVENIKNDVGNFSISRRTSYVFAEEIKNEINDLKAEITAVEEKAKFDGRATEKVSEYITVRS